MGVYFVWLFYSRDCVLLVLPGGFDMLSSSLLYVTAITLEYLPFLDSEHVE
jgi:hypothetical protein